LEKAKRKQLRTEAKVLYDQALNPNTDKDHIVPRFRVYMKDSFGGEYVGECEMSINRTEKGASGGSSQNQTTRRFTKVWKLGRIQWLRRMNRQDRGGGFRISLTAKG
jgi:hypothetical protein